MVIWIVFCIILIFIMISLFYFYQRHIKFTQKLILAKESNLHLQALVIETKELELQTKDQQLQSREREIHGIKQKLVEKDAEIGQVNTAKAVIEAKYQKKLKAAQVKKENLAAYHERKKDTRTFQEQVEEIVGKGPKWLAHSSKSPSSHQMGKPKGSKGGGRSRPEKVHETHELYPNRCDHCQMDVTGQKMYFVYDSIIIELSRELDEVGAYDVLRLKNICKQIYRCQCPMCKRWVYPDQGLFQNARFGVGFICYVISLRILLHLTYQEIILDLRKTFGRAITVSETAIIDWFLKFEDQIQAVYTQLETLIKESDFVHMDETGLPMMGENWWLWVVCTANLVLYHQSTGRSHASIEDVLKQFKGTIIADFFRAYEKFDDNEQQKCLAHLLSAIIEIMVKLEKENERITVKYQKSATVVARLQEDADTEVGEKKRGRKPKGEILTDHQKKVLKQQFEANMKTLKQAEALGTFFRAPFRDTVFNWEKPKAERITKSAAEKQLATLLQTIRTEGIINPELENIVKRCEKFQPELFTYLEHENMPPDNNAAERNLRKFVKQRKISGDFKSPEVGRHFVTYLSLFMTCKANQCDFDLLLEQMLSGKTVDLRSFLFTNSRA